MRDFISVVVVSLTLTAFAIQYPSGVIPGSYPNIYPLPVDVGGTGFNISTPYTILFGGATDISPLQQLSTTGSAGQILTSNGNGTLPSWQTNGGSFSKIDIQTFWSSSNYTPTSGMKYSIVEVVAAGGGGGGATAGNQEGSVAAGGGGAGGYVRGIISYAELVNTSQTIVSITVGAGGAPGSSGGDGNAGGNSSFGSFFAAAGGIGGGGATLVDPQQLVSSGAGGLGGPPIFPTNGSVVAARGASGSAGFAPYGGALGGMGAPGYFGGNAPNAVLNQFGFLNGNQGLLWGSGGSGGIVVSNGSFGPASGGNGSSGIVIVTEFS